MLIHGQSWGRMIVSTLQRHIPSPLAAVIVGDGNHPLRDGLRNKNLPPGYRERRAVNAKSTHEVGCMALAIGPDPTVTAILAFQVIEPLPVCPHKVQRPHSVKLHR